MDTGDNSELEFGYWKIKIKGHHFRWLIRFLGIEIKEWNPSSILEWRKKKDKLYRCNPLISIPYFREGELIVSKLGAIGMTICMRAGRKDLLGENPQELVLIRSLQSALNDIRAYAFELPNRSKKDIYLKFEREVKYKIKPVLKNFSIFLSNKPFLMGKKVKIIDFELVHMIEYFSWICNRLELIDPFKDFQNLAELRKNLFSLPGVKEYVLSKEERTMRWFLPGKAAFEVDHVDNKYKSPYRKI